MGSLPTCWYCPECGFVDNFCWKGPHYIPDQSRKCAGAMIEGPAIQHCKFTITTEAINENVVPIVDSAAADMGRIAASWKQNLLQMMVEVYARGVADGWRQGIAHMGGVGGNHATDDLPPR
jgi:hypothetical protein